MNLKLSSFLPLLRVFMERLSLILLYFSLLNNPLLYNTLRLLSLLSKLFSKVGILSFTTLGKTFFITFLDKEKYFPNWNGVASLTKVNHKASSIRLLFSLVPPWISLQASIVSLVRLWQVLFATGTAYSSELASDIEVGNLRLFRSFLFLTMSVSITLFFTNSTSFWILSTYERFAG